MIKRHASKLAVALALILILLGGLVLGSGTAAVKAAPAHSIASCVEPGPPCI